MIKSNNHIKKLLYKSKNKEKERKEKEKNIKSEISLKKLKK